MQKRFSQWKINLYFDGVEKDRMDLGSLRSKWADWNRIRQKVFNLSTANFELCLKAVEAIVDQSLEKSKAGEGAQERTDEAVTTLFKKSFDNGTAFKNFSSQNNEKVESV